MIITNLTNWTYKEELEGLLFFAQRFLELSYDKTDYSEKRLPTLPLDIINECLQYIKLEESGLFNVSDAELGLLFTELVNCIKENKTAKKILGDKKEYYLSKIKLDNDRKTIKNILIVIGMKFKNKEYFNLLQDDLKECIVNYKKKDNLYETTTALYQYLLFRGYQKATIYYLTNTFFFDRLGKKKITKINDIERFLSLFNMKIEKFDVVFSASKLFRLIEDSCKKFKIEIDLNKESLSYDNIENYFYKNKKDKKLFITCKDIRAVDYQHAMRKAKEKISLLLGLFVVFSHRNKPWISDYCLVYKHDKCNVVKINKQGNAMHSLGENDYSYTKEMFPIFISRFGLESESFQRFNRCIELHSLALDTDELASQIVNLWICLETLLITNKTNSHIKKVIENVCLINFSYAIRNRLTSLVDLLKKWNKEEFEKIKEKIKITDDNEAIAALVGVEKFKDITSDLLSKLNEQPLLRYKIFLMIKEIQTKGGIKKFLEKETEKCKRDINRVYRARNKIVHLGNLDGHNDYLVETIHHYLDLVLYAIIERRVKFNDILTIDNLIQEMQINVECHKNFLSGNNNEKLNEGNFISLIFGPDN
ncbi:hypothetical protein I4569_02450 [Proteus mirabilis]|nr:hypothetical protein [Proteus mirabilis]